MEVYLVGGAVRDQLLGLPVKERDWVVVGATPDEMIRLGYKPVGKDFPVFLHPKTHEEYALARTERKTGKGYKGFGFYADPSVTLEQDLKRRDLTINAIAKTPQGKLIDPFYGQKDLKKKIIRHVSEAFVEDPVRILRLARFASRFGDFRVHAKTMRLMKTMTLSGEIDALIEERVWREFERSLALNYCYRFFAILKQCGALAKLFPEIAANYRRVIALLRKATNKTKSTVVRFAVLSGALTEADIKRLSRRNKVPNSYRELALLVVRHKNDFALARKVNAGKLLIILERLDAFRRTERFNNYIEACNILINSGSRKSSVRLTNAFNIARNVTATDLVAQGLTGRQINIALHKKRVIAINAVYTHSASRCEYE